MWLAVVMEQLPEKVCKPESCGVVETSASLPIITRREETGIWDQTLAKGEYVFYKAKSILKG